MFLMLLPCEARLGRDFDRAALGWVTTYCRACLLGRLHLQSLPVHPKSDHKPRFPIKLDTYHWSRPRLHTRTYLLPQ
jgi:hypothetical protein